MQPTQESLPPEVKAALDRGNKIEAIKLLRHVTGLGLKEAKEAVERVEAGGSLNMPHKVFKGAGSAGIASLLLQGNKIEAIRLYREQNGVGLKDAKKAVEAMLADQQDSTSALAPGEVQRSSGLLWFAVAVVAGVVAAYFFF